MRWINGMVTWVHNRPKEYLLYQYGPNLSHTMVWDEKTQVYLKVKNHPYWNLVE
jgi:hypothetical protein